MSGDYSRKRFNPEKHYQGVLKQQGRVDLDAEWNEYVDLLDRRWRAETIDVVGRCGVPRETPDGFKMQLAAGQLTIGQGRIYVDGYLAENHGANRSFNPTFEEKYGTAPLSIASQPYGTGPVSSPTGVRSLVYVDVWRREVGHLQEPGLIEPAVNVDTTTRQQSAWQVKLLSNIPTAVTCQTPLTQVGNWPSGNLPSAARLTTATVAVTSEPDPCLVPPSGGYRGLENHLYRVEVHSVSGATARLKWSRENGNVAGQIIEILPGRTGLKVESLGRDDVLRFKTGDWVEITSDLREFGDLPGEMRIVTVDDSNQTMTFTPALPATEFPQGAAIPENHLRVIRWDQSGIVRRPDGSTLVNLDLSTDGLIPLTAADPSFVLEHGVQVTLSIVAGGAAHSGDYWCFAARTADADIEKLDQAAPAGIHHHFCKLAMIETNGTITDCRPIFPPLTELTSLFYVSGDGQEALPGQTLAKPIQVGVANGKWPVIGARVNFHITGGNGNLASGNSNGSDITIVTDNLGIASCSWTLDQSNQSQQVEARLADGSHLPVRFNAALAQAGGIEPGIHVKGINVANAPLLNDTNVTVTQLVNGIRVDCDGDLFQGSVRDKPVCMVTLDMPFPFNSADMQLWGSSVIGFTKLVLEAEVNSDNASIFWRPSREATAWLVGRLFQMMTELKRGERVLARLTLKGNFIWAQSDTDLYLDGEVFGTQTAAAGNTNIKLPSGDGRRGGDLEMWFWLIPPPPPPTVTTPTFTLTVPTLTATFPTFTATIVTRPTVIGPTLTRLPPTLVGGGGVIRDITSPTVIVPARPSRAARRRAANPFAQITSLRPAQAKKLSAAGIDDLPALAKASPREVMAALGLRSEARARALIAEAKRLSG